MIQLFSGDTKKERFTTNIIGCSKTLAVWSNYGRAKRSQLFIIFYFFSFKVEIELANIDLNTCKMHISTLAAACIFLLFLFCTKSFNFIIKELLVPHGLPISTRHYWKKQ